MTVLMWLFHLLDPCKTINHNGFNAFERTLTECLVHVVSCAHKPIEDVPESSATQLPPQNIRTPSPSVTSLESARWGAIFKDNARLLCLLPSAHLLRRDPLALVVVVLQLWRCRKATTRRVAERAACGERGARRVARMGGVEAGNEGKGRRK